MTETEIRYYYQGEEVVPAGEVERLRAENARLDSYQYTLTQRIAELEAALAAERAKCKDCGHIAELKRTLAAERDGYKACDNDLRRALDDLAAERAKTCDRCRHFERKARSERSRCGHPTLDVYHVYPGFCCTCWQPRPAAEPPQ